MPIYRGAYYSRTFAFSDETGAPLDITGWEFRSHFRAARTDPDPPILDLSTANTGFVVQDGPNGLLLMQMTATQTLDTEEASKLVFDVLRTDPTPGPIWLFEGSVPVKDPITKV